MRDWSVELAVIWEEEVERRKSGASRIRRMLVSVLARLEMASVIVDLVWSRSVLVKYLIL